MAALICMATRLSERVPTQDLTKRVILETYDEMARAIQTVHPWAWSVGPGRA